MMDYVFEYSVLFCPTPPAVGFLMPGIAKPGATMFPVVGMGCAACSVLRAFANHCSQSQAVQNHEIPVKK